MGTYIYQRLDKTIIADREGDSPLLVNIMKYYTKPLWSVWDYVGDRAPSYFSPYERKMLRRYNLFSRAAESRYERMRDEGRVSYYFVFAPDAWRGVTQLDLFKEPATSPYAFDSSWKMEQVGVLTRVGRKWRAVLDEYLVAERLKEGATV